MANRVGVFLDTNIFIFECFNFSVRSNLYYLKKLTSFGKINLLSNVIIVNEAKKHLEQEIKSSVNLINRTLNQKIVESNRTVKQALTVFKDMDEYESLFNNFKQDKKSMLDKAIIQFDCFLEETNTNILSNSTVNIEEILEDYFSLKAPFENGKNKKSEFPDAIMVKSLRSHVNEYDRIIVISKDKGFINAVDGLGQDKITHYDDLKLLLGEFIDGDFANESILVKEFIKDVNTRKEMVGCIKQKLLDGDKVHVDGMDYDKDGIISGIDFEETNVDNVSNIITSSISIKSINDDKADVVFDCVANIRISGSYFDEESSIWDSVDKEYIYLNYVNVIESHRVCFECTALLDISDIEDIHIDSVEFEDFTLDEETREQRIVEVDNQRELCHYCHDKPGVYFDSEYNWVCESCVADGENGIVCTHCGRLVSNDNFDGEMCDECRMSGDY